MICPVSSNIITTTDTVDRILIYETLICGWLQLPVMRMTPLIEKPNVTKVIIENKQTSYQSAAAAPKKA